MVPCRKNKHQLVSFLKALILLGVLSTAFLVGCSGDSGPPLNVDNTIPVSVTWAINSVMNQDPAQRTDITLSEDEEGYIDPQLSVFVQNDRVHMAYYDVNPDVDTRDEFPYRLMYKSFNRGDFLYLNSGNTVLEEVLLIDDDPRNRAGLSVSVAGGKPVIAYPVFKLYIVLEDSDLNNQGDVMIAVRDGAGTWRQEIAAYGYVSPERNPVFRDGLAQSDFCLLGNNEGQVMLSFQFYTEGIDSYNFDYPDLRYISQPVDAFVNNDVYAVADLEEVVEGNVYQNNASGQQKDQGRVNHLILDHDGNPVIFYYIDDTVNGSSQDFGIRYSRRVDGEWLTPQWIESGVTVAYISGAVKSDGGLFVAYTVTNVPDFIDSQTILPSIVKYAEQIDVITGYDDDGEEIHEWEWHYGYVNYNTICGSYLTMVLDASDHPVVAYYDEMNFTLNRFFSRIKVSRRTEAGNWEVFVITPEDVGLSNDVSPFDVTPGSTDIYYIGKYNHVWMDGNGRINLSSYSTVNKKTYLFVID
ncbi:MAG: hypothetical protein KKD44_07115 [Proteobacteria bacterium]|nr:hypothetical protein [Pseudomonadota bacterium]